MIAALRRVRAAVAVLLCLSIPLVVQARPPTTSGAIAIANLDYLLAQPGEPAQRIELLLARSRFLGDYEALDRAVALAESLPPDRDGLLLRARARGAAHRFEAALDDLRAAARSGAEPSRIDSQRAVILIATGRACDAVAQLERDVAAHPGYASHGALAGAYAALGRYPQAEREYRSALASLATTSPFPYAWLHFALGSMWSEQAGDPVRGEAEYDRALAYLPQFAVAALHKAEIEVRRGDVESAEARLLPLAQIQEPEALALLGQIRRQTGREREGTRDIAMAAGRYRDLLQRQPLAFADHAAEFYLGAGGDAALAWTLALRNLENRQTPRAYALAMRAALASGRTECERHLPGLYAARLACRHGTLPHAGAGAPRSPSR